MTPYFTGSADLDPRVTRATPDAADIGARGVILDSPETDAVPIEGNRAPHRKIPAHDVERHEIGVGITGHVPPSRRPA